MTLQTEQGRQIKSDLIWRRNLPSSCVCGCVRVCVCMCARAHQTPSKFLLVFFLRGVCLWILTSAADICKVKLKGFDSKMFSLLYIHSKQGHRDRSKQMEMTWAARNPFPIQLQRAYCRTSADWVIIVGPGKWMLCLQGTLTQAFTLKRKKNTSLTMTCRN